jgi:hypothetical protein
LDRSDDALFKRAHSIVKRPAANGIILTSVFCRDDLRRWSFGHAKLTSDEARKIAKAISRIPEFTMQRRGSSMDVCDLRKAGN